MSGEVRYWSQPSGNGVAFVSGTMDPPEDARLMTEDEWEAAVQEARDATQERVLATTRAQVAQGAEDYRTLVAFGIPAATASRLTGYTPTEGGTA